MINYEPIIHLGPIDSTDLPKLRTWRNDPRIWKWCRQHDLISDVDQDRWFMAQSKDPTVRMYAIYAKKKLVGVCGFTSIDMTNRRAEFSLYIGPEFQKKGYARAALKTLCKHGFRSLNLNSIWGETFDGNPACALFEELGFKKEGSRREFYFRDGHYIDAHLYSLLAREWGDRGFNRPPEDDALDALRYWLNGLIVVPGSSGTGPQTGYKEEA